MGTKNTKHQKGKIDGWIAMLSSIVCGLIVGVPVAILLLALHVI